MSFFFIQNIHAQVKDSISLGSITGVVKDSVYNYVLTAATVSVYNRQDASLLTYGLTDNYGKFNLSKLPLGVKLKVVASFIGYHPVSRDFVLSQNVKSLDLKAFNLDRSNTELKEIIISALPPVRMNGDTLEFNADAFNLDKNAVVEDLMRRLPGITIWGDGSITVNGKQVDGVKVNGKPFFGGSAAIATQNLPKNTVDKIQVYRVNRNPLNPLDSLSEINIKLKKSESNGVFGKVSAGYGSTKTRDIDGNLNLFTPRTQASLVAANNNVNKVAEDAETLIRNSTYKGIGTSIDYQPNFVKPGLSVNNVIGYKFMHDFIPDANNYKNNRLEADYFYSSNSEELNSQNVIETRLSTGSNVFKSINSANAPHSRKHQLKGSYNNHSGNNNLSTEIGFLSNKMVNQSSRFERFSASANDAESSRNSSEIYDGNYHSFNGSISYRHDKDRFSENSLPENYSIRYGLSHTRNSASRGNLSEFLSNGNPLHSLNFDRIYVNEQSSTNHNFYTSIGDLSRWKLNVIGFLRNISVTFENNLDVTSSQAKNEVHEKKDPTERYYLNGYLTAGSQYTLIDEKPALSFNKRLSKSLASRFNKEVSINLKLQQQFYYHENFSVREDLKFKQEFQKFIPNAGILYTNQQYGAFEQKFSINFSKSAIYPLLDDLITLTDSLNVYQIKLGNASLRPSAKFEIELNSQRFIYRGKNTFNFQANSKLGKIDRMMVYSNNIDSLGRATTFKRNADGYRYLTLTGIMNKAFKLNQHNQIQLRGYIYVHLAKSPAFINENLIESNLFTNTDSLNVYYSFKDLLAFNVRQAFSVYNSTQSLSDNAFRGRTHSTTLSGSVNFLRKFTMATNITYNNYKANEYSDDFTTWNAHVSARFLDAKNLELKFSALDILRQNQNITNYGHDNVLVYGKTNILQQYFMMTISYYPRKFGIFNSKITGKN